jgi:hypothetical protein
MPTQLSQAREGNSPTERRAHELCRVSGADAQTMAACRRISLWCQAPPDEKTDAGLDFFLLLIAAPLLCWKKTFISLTYKLFFFF